MKMPDGIETKLPYGDHLRQLLIESYIGAGDIRYLLQEKGIFVSSSKKEDTVPVLAASLLTPNEFEYLCEKQASKEDERKVVSLPLKWKGNKTLSEVLPERYNLSERAKPKFGKYKIVGSPTFVVESDNSARIDYQVERVVRTNAWSSAKSIFKGSVAIKKDGDDLLMKMVGFHTSDECKEVNSVVFRDLKNRFQEVGAIEKKVDPQPIRFFDFDNANRFKFLLGFASDDVLSCIEYKKITNFELAPDDSLVLPDNEEIKWMEQKVEALKISGDLMSTVLLSENNYHEYFYAWRMESEYELDCSYGRGSCSLVFEFNGFSPKKDDDSQFEIHIRNLNFEGKRKTEEEKERIRMQILEAADTLKIKMGEDILGRAVKKKVVRKNITK